MKINLKLLATLVFANITIILLLPVAGDNQWAYELQDVKCVSENKDLYDCQFEVLRKSRGVFGLSGYMDIKFDADDSLIVEGYIYRSMGMAQSYYKMPFDIANETLTEVMNKFYIPLIMDDIKDCSVDAYNSETFEPPLTKRKIILDKCLISTDKLPSHMSEGNYRLDIYFHGPCESRFELYFKIEKAY